MQQTVKLWFARWLLAVVLFCGVGVGNPVKAHNRQIAVNMDDCVLYSRALLWNVTDALAHDDLFRGINCTEQNMEVNTRTQTVSECQPSHQQDTSCYGYSSTAFDQDKCLMNVMEDLQYYRNILRVYSVPALGSTLLRSIDNLLERCFSSFAPEGVSAAMVSPVPGNTFDERLKLCKVLKGFRIRAITINRVIGYIAAGDYKI